MLDKFNELYNRIIKEATEYQEKNDLVTEEKAEEQQVEEEQKEDDTTEK